jgi:hypothetical protein
MGGREGGMGRERGAGMLSCGSSKGPGILRCGGWDGVRGR